MIEIYDIKNKLSLKVILSFFCVIHGSFSSLHFVGSKQSLISIQMCIVKNYK